MFILARAVCLCDASSSASCWCFCPPASSSGRGLRLRRSALRESSAPVALAGAAIAVSCVIAFAFIGRGARALRSTAPARRSRTVSFRAESDVPRRGDGVVRRGALLRVAGARDVHADLLLVAHGFVTAYEEPTLPAPSARPAEYCRRVGRWWPRRWLVASDYRSLAGLSTGLISRIGVPSIASSALTRKRVSPSTSTIVVR